MGNLPNAPDLLDGDRNESPAHELARIISDISEDYACATWEIEVEFRVWRWVLERPTEDFGPLLPGMTVCVSDLDRCRELAAQIGGWVRWVKHKPAELDDDQLGVRFVPMAEWEQLYAEYRRKWGLA